MNACYVHVPFCKDICSYCDFMRCRYHQGLADKWLPCIKQEIDEKLVESNLVTCYIGGGTPSALDLTQLTQLLQFMIPYTSRVMEYTMEANIDSLTDDKLAIIKKNGINRISLGVQTLQPALLKRIQRNHDKATVIHAIQNIHKHGIHNISIDLMYGLPDQTMEQWQEDLTDAVKMDIQHISLYALTIEEHSAFGREGVEAMDETLESEMYLYAIDYLEQQGFEHYEISNFAKVGYTSKHNLMYWHYEDFAGIGCGASGKSHHRRYDNTKNLQTYFEIGANSDTIELNKNDELFEAIMMGLRLKEGINLERFKTLYDVDVYEHFKAVIDDEIMNERLHLEGGNLKTTKTGMLLLHDVLIRFLD